jgi:hypothetical protein
MLNELKNKLLQSNLNYYKNIEITHDELIISADDFTGYELIQETLLIDKLIDKKLFIVKHLNNNIIKVKNKRKSKS